jgi:hypothetical protein
MGRRNLSPRFSISGSIAQPPEHPHQGGDIVAALMADDPPAIADRANHSLDGALPFGRRTQLHASAAGGSHRCVPCGGEAFGAFPVAERIGGLAAHADHPGGLAGAEALRQERNEGALPLGAPAIAAAAQRNGLEGERFGRLHPQLMTDRRACRKMVSGRPGNRHPSQIAEG